MKNKPVMLNSFQHLLITMLCGALLCLVLAGCENFMRGSNAKEELERQIAYANAPKVVVKIRLDSSDYGTIYPPSIKVAQGDIFTVEFTQNRNTVFRYWTITNPTTGEDLDDKYISITKETVEEDTIEKTVTRKITLVMNSLPQDIEIRPKCYLTTETTPPEFTRLNIAKSEQDAAAGTNLINIFDNPALNKFDYYATKVNYNNDSSAVAANIRNHHVNSLWIDLEAYDLNSGVDSIEIKETLLYTKKTEYVTNGTTYTTNYDLTPEVWQPSVEKLFKHEFKTTDDGVIGVTVTLYDKSGNTASKSFDVVKDSICEVSLEPYVSTSEYQILAEGDNDSFYDVPMYSIYNGFGNGWQYVPEIYIYDLDGNEYTDTDHLVVTTDTLILNLDVDFTPIIKPYIKFEVIYDGVEVHELALENLDITAEHFKVNRAGDTHYYYGKIYYNVQVDDSRDTIVRATIYDEAGNAKALQYEFYKSSWINRVQVDETNREITFFWDPEFGPGYPYVKCGNSNYNFNAGLSGTSYYIPDSIYDSSKNKLKEGILEVYLLRCRNLSGGQFRSRGIKPYLIYNGVPAPDVVDLSTCELPDFTCNVSPCQINTGKRTVNVNITQPFTPVQNVKYMVQCVGGDDFSSCKEITDFSKTISFDIPTSESTNPYNVKIVLMNSNGIDSVESGNYSIGTLNEDNYPPSVSEYKTVVFPDRRIILLNSNTDTFDNQGLKTDPDNPDNILVKYIYSNVKDLIEKGIDWTDSQIVRQYSQPATNQTLDPPRIELPFDGTNGNYCYVLLEDNNGNYTEKRFDLVTIYREKPTGDDIYSTAPEVKVIRTDSYGNSCEPYYQVEWNDREYRFNWNATNFYINNNQWTLTYQSSPFYTSINTWYGKSDSYLVNNNQDNSPYWRFKVKSTGRGSHETTHYYNRFKIELQPMPSEEWSFIKTYIWSDDSRTSSDGGYFDVIYWWPSYVSYPDYERYQPKKRIFIKANQGYYVEVNVPCFLHTLYSTVDLGDIQSWVNEGIEVKVQMSSNFGTWETEFMYEEPLDKIPSGKYYTTIIHYADGKMENSPVKIR